MYTALFRGDTQFNTVIDLALESRLDSENVKPLTILSVGSSFGAEADSVLGYLASTYSDVGRVSLIGMRPKPKSY